jgi:ribosomal protein S18 acetylase RimI-like enzyme
MGAIAVEHARPEDREAALRLLFQHLVPAEREKRVANALHLMELGTLKPEGLLVVRASPRVVGAMLGLPVPGASAQVWPPRTVRTANRVAIEDALVRHATAWLHGRGAKLGQALLGKHEVPLAATLERNGFRHTTTLWYMRHTAPNEGGIASAELTLRFSPYQPENAELFQRTLLRTYEQSRDCPEVSGVRTAGEIIDGHRADASQNAEHWWLAFDGEQPAGVLLANESAEWESLEVSYVGVVPEARGRGLGRQLMLKAILTAQSAQLTQMTLCVDSRNTPAIALYRSLGFQRYDERAVYIAVWQSAGRENPIQSPDRQGGV